MNGVRLMFLKEGRQTLLVCSSNAMKPQLRELDAVTLRERSSPENVIGVCSPDPNLNTTATLVGNLSHFSHNYALNSVNNYYVTFCNRTNVLLGS